MKDEPEGPSCSSFILHPSSFLDNHSPQRRSRPMRRTYAVLGLVAAAGVGLLAWSTSRTTAEPSSNTARRSDQPAAPALPLTNVVLFNSGVGYFQREGTVEGASR